MCLALCYVHTMLRGPVYLFMHAIRPPPVMLNNHPVATLESCTANTKKTYQSRRFNVDVQPSESAPSSCRAIHFPPLADFDEQFPDLPVIVKILTAKPPGEGHLVGRSRPVLVSHTYIYFSVAFCPSSLPS